MRLSPPAGRIRLISADSACVLALLAITLAVYAPALFGGKVLLPADIVPLMAPYSAAAREKFPEYRFAQNQLHGPIFEYYSWRHYARVRIRAGEVPLWNPYELSGNVLLANSQSAVLYPPNALLYVFSLPTGINLVTALHTFLTGMFMFGLLRARRLTPVSSLTGALVWTFCGLQIVWTEFQTPTAALCWLPGILWMWQLYAGGRSWKWAVFGSGTGICLTLLAGHLHFAFYVVLAFIIYTIVPSQPDLQNPKSKIAALLGALAFGLLLSMATILPVVEMSRMNFRATKSYSDSVALAIPPANLLTLALPNLFGNPRDYVAFTPDGAPTEGNAYWGKFDFIEYTCYLGIPALILALAAIFGIRRRDLSRAGPVVFLAIGLIGLLLALGTPLCALFFYAVPGYKQFNATARALCLFSFGFAALSAYGLDALVSSEHRKRAVSTLAAAAGVIVLIGLAAFPGMGLVWRKLLTDQWFPYSLAGLKHFTLFTLLFCAAVWLALRENGRRMMWLIPGVAVADLLVWSAGFNPITDPAMLNHRSEVTQFLRAAAPDRAASFEEPGGGIKSFIVPNFNAVAGYREIQGADSLHTRRYHQLIEKMALSIDPSRIPPFPDPNTVRIPPGGHPILDMLNLRYVATRVTLPAERYRPHQTLELPVYENSRAFGQAWISSSVKRFNGIHDAFSLMESGLDLKVTALVETDILPLHRPSPGTESARVVSFSPHRIEVLASCAGEGILTLSEPYFPGWRASVNGAPTAMIPVHYILRGIRLSPGESTVVFQYEPASYRLGLFLTCLAAALFGGMLSTSLIRRRLR